MNILLTVIVLIAFLGSSADIHAQSGKLPPFKILQSDEKIFRAQDLPIGKPVVIVYFSPDCDHCEKMMKEFVKHQSHLKKASVAMITYLPVDQVTKFVQQYKLDKQANIYVGTEGSTFFVKNYYHIEHMPFMALHDKDGNMVQVYREEGAVPELVSRLNKLK